MSIKEGSIIVNQTEILKEIEIFYINLYENKDDTLENVDLQEYMKDKYLTKLTNQEAKKLHLHCFYLFDRLRPTVFQKIIINSTHLISDFIFDFTAAGVVPCGGRKTSPRISTIVKFIFFLVL